MADPGQWRLECPRCQAVSDEPIENCPRCGQDLMDAFAGTYVAGATSGRRVFSVIVLVVIALGLMAAVAWIVSGGA